MHISRIEYERWSQGSRPEPAWRWPGFLPVAFLLLLVAKLAWIMAAPPVPGPDVPAQILAAWSLGGP